MYHAVNSARVRDGGVPRTANGVLQLYARHTRTNLHAYNMFVLCVRGRLDASIYFRANHFY